MIEDQNETFEEEKETSNFKQILKKPLFWGIVGSCVVVIVIIIIAVTVSSNKNKNNEGNSTVEEGSSSGGDDSHTPKRYLCLDNNGKESHDCYGCWFYQESTHTAEESAEWLAKHNMNYVFLIGLVDTESSRQRFRNYARELSKRNIAFHVMTLIGAEPLYYPELSVELLTNITDFIQEENLTVAGIHVDIEPHALKEWTSETKDAIFQKYLALLEQLRQVMDRKPELLFSAAVAWWYSSNTQEGKLSNGRGYDLVNDKRLHMLVPMLYWEDGQKHNETDQILIGGRYYLDDGADTVIGIRVDEQVDFDQTVKDIKSSFGSDPSVKDHFFGVTAFSNTKFDDWVSD